MSRIKTLNSLGTGHIPSSISKLKSNAYGSPMYQSYKQGVGRKTKA